LRFNQLKKSKIQSLIQDHHSLVKIECHEYDHHWWNQKKYYESIKPNEFNHILKNNHIKRLQKLDNILDAHLAGIHDLINIVHSYTAEEAPAQEFLNNKKQKKEEKRMKNVNLLAKRSSFSYGLFGCFSSSANKKEEQENKNNMQHQSSVKSTMT
jgi:hypothetical protein